MIEYVALISVEGEQYLERLLGMSTLCLLTSEDGRADKEETIHFFACVVPSWGRVSDPALSRPRVYLGPFLVAKTYPEHRLHSMVRFVLTIDLATLLFPAFLLDSFQPSFSESNLIDLSSRVQSLESKPPKTQIGLDTVTCVVHPRGEGTWSMHRG